MHRRALLAAAGQLPLDLCPTADLAKESALRAAYMGLDLSRHLTFEQVMADPAYAIGIRNLAEAMARRRNRGSVACARAKHLLHP